MKLRNMALSNTTPNSIFPASPNSFDWLYSYINYKELRLICLC
ncbi:MAG TPA: hypothetical protein PLE33_03585 [Candidatus Cloacimonas sp.]|nr:hypothetical protein [Candidatus Cloacimonas sp.]